MINFNWSDLKIEKIQILVYNFNLYREEFRWNVSLMTLECFSNTTILHYVRCILKDF